MQKTNSGLKLRRAAGKLLKLKLVGKSVDYYDLKAKTRVSMAVSDYAKYQRKLRKGVQRLRPDHFEPVPQKKMIRTLPKQDKLETRGTSVAVAIVPKTHVKPSNKKIVSPRFYNDFPRYILTDYLFYRHRGRIKIIRTKCDNGWQRDLTLDGDVELNPGPRRRVNNRPRRRRRNQQNGPNVRDVSAIQVNNIMPMIKRATLKYLDGSTVRNNPGGNFLVYSMRINDLFDPDPLILSGSVSNFKEMMQFYSYYRVMMTSMQWTVVNLENFPLSCGIVFSQTNLVGAIASLADCQNAFENDFVVPVRTLSARGGMDRTQFRINKLSLPKLLGVGTQYRSELNYSGLGLATPTIPLWANFIVFAPTGAAMSNGYANSTTLYFTAEFYGRLNVRS